MQVKGSWLEVRCNAPGVLEPLGYHVTEPPQEAEQHARIFSIVVDESTERTRALPVLYHGPAQLYADRRVENLGLRLNRALEAIAAVQEGEAIYTATACRLGESIGLYTRDLFNRSSFRIHLSRLGVEFAEDPYVRLLPSGRFHSRDWGEFEPEWLVAGAPYPKDPDEIADRRGGMAPFMFGVLRMGRITAPELKHLADLVRRIHVLSTQSPRALAEALGAA